MSLGSMTARTIEMLPDAFHNASRGPFSAEENDCEEVLRLLNKERESKNQLRSTTWTVFFHVDSSSLRYSFPPETQTNPTWGYSSNIVLDEILLHVPEESTRNFIRDEGLDFSVAWANSKLSALFGGVGFHVELLPDDGDGIGQLAFIIHASMDRTMFRRQKRSFYRSMRTMGHLDLYQITSVFTNESLT